MKVLWFCLSLLFFTINLEAVPSQKIEALLHGRIKRSSKRYIPFLKALKLMNEKRVRTIVQTCSLRQLDIDFVKKIPKSESIVFADWSTRQNGLFICLDTDEKRVYCLQQVLGAYASNIKIFFVDNTQYYLNGFKQPVDMLYLGSCDYDVAVLQKAQEHVLKELLAIYPKLTESSIIMIDHGTKKFEGKGKLAIHYLLCNDWKMIQDRPYAIFVRD